jgi:hypothetical protein
VGGLAGQNTGSVNALTGLFTQGGANQAGGILGQANAQNSMTSGLLNGLSSLAGNSQLLSALGIGGGIKTTQSNLLGPSYNYARESIAPMNLNTSIPAF